MQRPDDIPGAAVDRKPAINDSRVAQSSYRTYLLVLLMVILAFNYVDRLALGLVLQDIERDLSLSDTQLGFLSGIAFALFYAAMGIPIARWADRGNRVTIVALTTTLWSVMVVLCGLARSFLQLLAIRIGVAVGEAGCIPAANSLIPDYFTRAERPRAAGIYMLGGSLSVVIGYFAAGWLNQFYGWRATFIMLGAPGLVLAGLARFTLREPRVARHGKREFASQPVQAGMYEVWTTLWANVTFRHLLLCFSVVFFFSYGIGQWLPTFFMRSYGLKTGELGTWFAVIFGIGGALGTYSGGALASRCAARNERLQLRAMAVAYGGFAIVYAFLYLSTNLYLAFGLMGGATIVGNMATGPLFGAIQSLVPGRMRATSVAIVYLFANLIGMGLGPLATGAMSDAFHAWAGQESLRYALLALCPGYFWGAWHLWRASKTVTRDMAVVHAEEGDHAADVASAVPAEALASRTGAEL